MGITDQQGAALDIRRIGPSEQDAVIAAGHLFDMAPTPDGASDFLRRSGHHLLIGYQNIEPVGFVTGVEIAHPDKAVEMLLYELGVDERHRRRGIGQQLAAALRDHAQAIGCRSMWVPVDSDDPPAVATYRRAGASGLEDAQILTWEFPHATPTAE